MKNIKKLGENLYDLTLIKKVVVVGSFSVYRIIKKNSILFLKEFQKSLIMIEFRFVIKYYRRSHGILRKCWVKCF